MTRRSYGEGSFQHIVPKKCEDCKKYAECTIRLAPSLKCKKRDSKDYWRYQYYATKIDGTPERRSLQARTKKQLEARVEKMRMENGEVNNDTITVGQWCDRWKDAILPGTIKKSTLDSYKYMLS